MIFIYFSMKVKISHSYYHINDKNELDLQHRRSGKIISLCKISIFIGENDFR